jgi:hypothetical protein
VRQLRTDCDEVLFDAARPVLLNGIEDIVTRPDLADRAVFLNLEAIPEERRRPEGELWAAFELERPRILGALLDAAAAGLAALPTTNLEQLPRMADFALWATACESAFGPSGAFMAAYNRSRDEAMKDVIDADPIATALCTFMVGRAAWAGTASELLRDLAPIVGQRVARSSSWPASARALSGPLRRAATPLRKVGVDITFTREGRGGTRMIRMSRSGPASQPPAGVAASSPKPGAHAADADGLTRGNRADESSTVSRKPPEISALPLADGADATAPAQEEDQLHLRASRP